jgi:putative membrane protein
MQLRTLAALSAATMALAACGSKADNAAPETNLATAQMNDTVAAPALSPGQAFANTAAASDAFEIASSKLAIATSRLTAIKSFASKMIDGHTASTAKLTAAAAAASPALTPDATLTREQQAKLDALKTAEGNAFDQAYVDDQVAGHEATLAALKDYSANGDVASLKTFAAGLVPTVTAHLDMAKGLKP